VEKIRGVSSQHLSGFKLSYKGQLW